MLAPCLSLHLEANPEGHPPTLAKVPHRCDQRGGRLGRGHDASRPWSRCWQCAAGRCGLVPDDLESEAGLTRLSLMRERGRGFSIFFRSMPSMPSPVVRHCWRPLATSKLSPRDFARHLCGERSPRDERGSQTASERSQWSSASGTWRIRSRPGTTCGVGSSSQSMTHACRGPVDADDPAPHAVGYAGLGSRGSRRAFEAIPNCVDGMSRRTICHDYGGIFTAGAPDTRVAPTISVVGTEWAAWVGRSTGAWSGSQESQPG